LDDAAQQVAKQGKPFAAKGLATVEEIGSPKLAQCRLVASKNLRTEAGTSGDMAWFGQRYDFNGLMVWTGGRWRSSERLQPLKSPSSNSRTLTMNHFRLPSLRNSDRL
jgi:hypothetical protein